MKNNNLKNIWKSEIDKQVKYYSDEELKDMVIQSARKSMRAIQPNIILRIIIAAIIIFLIWSIILRNEASSIKILHCAALFILLISYFLMERSVRKLNWHKMDVPIKEWLKYRIDKVEKSRNYMVKYDFLIFGGVLLLGYIFYFAFQILRGIHFNWISVIVFIILFIYVAIIRHFRIKNYNKTLQQLKELYKQLDVTIQPG